MLPNIELSKEEFLKLKEITYLSGGEGHIHKINNEVIKIFDLKDFSEDEKEVILENKLNKLIELHKMKDYNEEVKPLSTYSFNDNFIGYSMPYLSYPSLEFSCFFEKDLIKYLKKLKEKLIYLHSLGIVYGDIKSDNIFIDINRSKVILIDIDNMQINDYPIDIYNTYAEDFVKKYGSTNEYLDFYMLNLLTLTEIFKNPFWYSGAINDMKLGLLPFKISNKKTRKIARNMVYNQKNYNGECFIDYL